MIFLDATTRSLEVKLGGAPATTQPPWVTSFVDISQSTFAMTGASASTGATNSGTAVTIVAAPGATTTRKLEYFSLVNVDTAGVTVTVQLNDNGTLRIVLKAVMAIGDQLVYTESHGWALFDSTGAMKAVSNLPNPISQDLLFVDATYDIGKSGATRPRDVFLSRDLTVGRNLMPGTINADMPFTDATYDIGKSGATRPRDGFFSRDITVGRNLVPGTVVADLLFTDATYDIGKTGATRPRDGFFSRNLVVGGSITPSGLVVPRITTITSSATPTIDTDTCDAVTITALAVAITSMTTNLSGAPVNFQKLIIRIKDDGTARAITWGASFVAKGVALPTTTVMSKLLTVGFLYDTVAVSWGCVASAQEA